MPPIDIAQVRADTPACERAIHFNNAGASLMPRPVYDAVAEHLALENTLGGYEAADQVHERLEGFYAAIGNLLSARPEEIAFVENATRAWDMAFYALPLQAGDRILTHESEYGSNYLALLHLAGQRGIHIDLVPSDESGQVDVVAMDAMVQPRTKAIALTHVPSQGGLVNPAAEVGRLSRAHNLTYVLDACQSAGQMPLNVQSLGCDVLAGTGRKFLRGPRGTGFLYVSERILEQLHPPFIDMQAARWIDQDRYELRPDARRFETWERFVAGQIGLAEAARYAMALGLSAIYERIQSLAASLRGQLAEIPGLSICDTGVERCGIVTFTRAGRDTDALVSALRNQRINVKKTPDATARLDFGRRGIHSVVRASVHYFNTEEEIERFCDVLARL